MTKALPKPAPKAEIKEMTVSTRPALPAHKPRGRSVQASLLFVIGLGTTLLGVAMVFAPKLPWNVDGIVAAFALLGVGGGTLVVCGLMMLGLALVLREVARVAAFTAQSSEDTSLLESVAADVLQVGSVVEGVQASLRGVSSELGGLGSAIAAVGEQAAAAAAASAAARSAPESLGSEDAIFRLAASLDKVGAKIEERLKTQFSDLTERLGKLEASVAETAKRLERSQVAPPPPAAPAPRPAAYPAPALHQTAHYAQPQPAAAGGYPLHPQAPAQYGHPAAGHPGAQPPAHRPAPAVQMQPLAAPHPPQAYAPENPKSLGLLDHLDDNGVPAPMPAPGQLHFDAPPQLSLADVPPQADPWGQQPGIPMNPVMSDPEVRAALEDMGRQGR